MCTTAQGGLTLAQVLSILRQVVAGLLHLHSLGILHRDLRAANLLIDSLDPLRVLVADFGVSHLLSAFAAGVRAVDLTASKVPSVVMGAAALGPLQVRPFWLCIAPMSVCCWLSLLLARPRCQVLRPRPELQSPSLTSPAPLPDQRTHLCELQHECGCGRSKGGGAVAA